MKGRGRLLLDLCFLVLLTGTSLGRDRQTEHLASYQLTVPRPLGGRLRREADGAPASQLSFVVPLLGRDHVIHLSKNRLLLSPDFRVFTYSKNGSLLTHSPPVQNHCHYQGFVQDMDGSSVAMSVCDGLRGVLHLADDSYGIEPLDSSPPNHILYRLQDVTSQPWGCGVPHTQNSNMNQSQEVHKLHTRVRRAVLHRTHYVELLLVVDNERVTHSLTHSHTHTHTHTDTHSGITGVFVLQFSFMNKNETAVREEMILLANYIDGIYQQLNVRVVLVGLEIWNQQNRISTEGGAQDVLSRFTQWRERELLPRRRHDSAQLILKKSFGITAGMAFVSTVCSRTHGGGINTFPNNNVAAFSSIVAHELGHNLGMNHDDGRSCTCPSSACIMNSGATGSRNFSSCSADDFEKMILASGASCLLNVPRPDEAYSAPYCGNGLVDVGEECDCGSQQECEGDPCCEFHTCRLRPGAQCAVGECCRSCQFLPAGSVCRSSTDECDLPEFCNGSSSLCQSDVSVQDGQPCRQGQAFCYNGKCQHYEGQCRTLFGPKARTAPSICFEDINSIGDRFGNCGYHNYGYKKCERRNALCGKLQCTNVEEVQAFGIKPSVITTPIGGATCYGVDFRLGSDVADPGMVNEGTKCGEDKVCMNFECRSVDVLNFDCDVEVKCHGHGVCNSNKNCHCDEGWAPPTCEQRGYGGSVDSGPTWNDKDTSLRDGLLVFFLLICPLAGLAVFFFLRRNQLVSRLRRHKRHQADGASSLNRAPPSRAPSSSVTRGNGNNNIREGQNVQLLHPQQLAEPNRTMPTFATRPPPPPLKPKPPVQPVMPLRPAPPPPV
ncbi:disintegrin and metalloproteinase domain-containing protein 9 isoform X2 [Synchiropus splendidus]|uniref:disintegrin and metalloproteinase domain-containing protein 9 isoform X2 n=1 Tax=Synchiropus splendidus TaxID=270530 RepID=UPI00237E1FDA|nr:disintegrin and metalloproteinase domain-containing protein 9 isoform X2 [Synchiropus splendidus]